MTLNCHRIAKAGRAAIAIAAAYAFVLQVLLLSVMASQAAPTAANSLSYAVCFGSGDNSHSTTDEKTPAKAIHCSLLCAQAMSAAAPAPSDISLGFVFANSTSLPVIAVATPNVRAPPSPKLSQGPPQIA